MAKGLITALLALVTFPAFAQPQCGLSDDVIPQILDHGEQPVWEGLSANGHILTIWFNPKSGSWTGTFYPLGDRDVICLFGTGEEGKFRPQSKGGKPA